MGNKKYDDLSWIDDVVMNPWLVYDVIILDVPMTWDAVNTIIEFGLHSGRVCEKSKFNWDYEDRNDDIGNIIEYVNRYGESYLRINDDGFLMYGDNIKAVYDGYDGVLKYSEFGGKKINESEDDGLDWIREVKPYRNITTLHPGDRFMITNISGLALTEYDKCRELKHHDPYSTIFVMTNTNNFLVNNTSGHIDFITNEDPNDIVDVWLNVEGVSDSNWISVNNIIVTKI